MQHRAIWKQHNKIKYLTIALITILTMACSASPPDSMMQNNVTIQSKDGKVLYKSNGSLKDLMDNYWSPVAKSKIKCSKSGGAYEFSFKSKSYDKVELTIAENGNLKKLIFKGGSDTMEVTDEKADALHNVAMGLFQFDAVNQ